MTRKKKTPAPDLSHIHPQLHALATPIEALISDPHNARTHSRANLDAIKRSLERFGFRAPLVAQRDPDYEIMVVRSGNGRLQAARELGYTTVPVLVFSAEDHEALAYALADNRTAELAGWNWAVLSEHLREIPRAETLGWDSAELDRILSKSWETTTLPENPEPKFENPPELTSEEEAALRDSWSTPEWLWKLGLEIAGRDPATDAFDLDPCTSPHSTVPAARKYTRAQDGLAPAHLWSGLVWLNPPYSNPFPWFQQAALTVIQEPDSTIIGVARLDPSTEAWKHYGPDFAILLPQRVNFVPPAGIQPSSSSNIYCAVTIWVPSERRDEMHERAERLCQRDGTYLAIRQQPEPDT